MHRKNTGRLARQRARVTRPAKIGRDEAVVRIAVCGAHMSGLPLNHQLTDRGARLRGDARTAANYRLFALPGASPARPGLVRADSGGKIEVEVWEVPISHFGSLVATVPAPLGIGTVELEDGERVKGFLCEAHATQGARDITDLASWRRYLTHQNTG